MDTLKGMERLLALKFQQKQQRFVAVLAQETTLKGQLSQLAEQESTARQSMSGTAQLLGADLVWNTWLERTRKELNIELAQVLAQKEQMLRSVRKDYGKLLVAEEISRLTVAQSVSERRKTQLDESVTGHVNHQMIAEKRKKGQ